MSRIAGEMQKLRDLERIAGLILEEELAALKRLARMQEETGREIRRLREMASDRARALVNCGAEDPAFLAGQDQTWRRWEEERRALLNNRLARLRANHEMQKAKASLAFGRAEAVRKLIGQNQTRRKP